MRLGALGQGVFVVAFYALRSAFEHVTERVTARRSWGGDAMPPLTFIGVSLHTLVLSLVLLPSIKHPLVFAALIGLDVVENAYCLYSLWVSAKKTGAGAGMAAVAPAAGDGGVGRTRSSLRRGSSTANVVAIARTMSQTGVAAEKRRQVRGRAHAHTREYAQRVSMCLGTRGQFGCVPHIHVLDDTLGFTQSRAL